MSMEQGPPVPPRPPGTDRDLNIPPLRETAARAESRRADLRGRLSGLVAGLAVAGILMAGSYWLGYRMGVEKAPPGEVPLIRAEPGPVKVPPEAPGGLQVPNQDRLVFEGVTEGGSEAAATLAAPPEEPAPLPRITETDRPAEAGPEPEAGETRAPIVVEGADIARQAEAVPAAAASAEPSSPAAADDRRAAGPAAAPESPAVASAPAEETSGPVALVPPPPAAESSAPASSAAPPPRAAAAGTRTAAASGPRIQVGAYRSRAAALRGWSIIRRAHEALLGGLEPTVVEADLGPGRGIFFRLQAGPLADAESAARLCERLRGRDQGCLVVRP